MLESPTNPRMQICDIRAISEAAHAAGALVCVDNSIMAPMFQRPLDLGADICMTSATKFIAGHSDVTGGKPAAVGRSKACGVYKQTSGARHRTPAGILSVRGKELGDRLYFYQNAEGTHLAPFDCWLSLRGLKTMALRMERAAENAQKLAEFLARHPLVTRVNYAGLPSHPGHKLHFSQATSGGSILSFATGNLEASKVIVDQTKLFKVRPRAAVPGPKCHPIARNPLSGHRELWLVHVPDLAAVLHVPRFDPCRGPGCPGAA